ncbi:Stp1/IreP family PP2C-type Ser/Thr phosphatase [Rubrobacter aplysinae]|uniref:Stp1/IreP family PP2C-type Ser/Thr phosphatase n=1 Tax=Rubrobacter aplysinae TaxID=909625 RepID=UPI00069D730B|nr:Stp1/IreP family PP2C-type Ser/Thr phosphatase [Rubrobacter aplysinae]
MLSLDHFGLTDPGRVRENNEDSLLSGGGRDPALFAVADGVGGFEAGEVASSMVIESLENLEPGDPLQPAIREANRRVYSAARENEKLSGMGTTVVAARIEESGGGVEAEIAHVGDSRAYLLRDGELSPLTEDHSLVAELVRSGSLTRAQASDHPQKNLITRALGAEEEVEVDSARYRLRRGDRLVLCSDGLPDMVAETRISELASGGPGGDPGTAEESARSLLSAALSSGGSDNVTVVVVDVEQEARRSSAAQESPEAPSPTSVGTTGGTREPATPPPPDTPGGGEPTEERPSRVRRLRGREKRGEARRRRRRSAIRSSDETGGDEARSAGQRGGRGREGSYSGPGEGESLIPGVWDGVAVEEEPEPREPTPEEVVERYRIRPEPDERETQGDPRRRQRRRKRLAAGGKAISALIRGLAVVALLGLLLVPPYLWWSTRYFMAYEEGEVVIHQGVPYDFLGNELNRVDQRTGVKESDIAEPYRDQVQDNRLYTEGRLQTVLEDLQKQ